MRNIVTLSLSSAFTKSNMKSLLGMFSLFMVSAPSKAAHSFFTSSLQPICGLHLPRFIRWETTNSGTFASYNVVRHNFMIILIHLSSSVLLSLCPVHFLSSLVILSVTFVLCHVQQRLAEHCPYHISLRFFQFISLRKVSCYVCTC